MTPGAYAIACIAVLIIFALLTSNDRLRTQRDIHIIRGDRAQQRLADERAAHLRTFRRAIRAEAKVAELEADLVEAGQEAATHADHLTAVMDAVAEGKPLTLVKGGQR